ncbi:MAG: hypothetical protein JRG91_15935 [Deltaproteobacteria bacterium]|nr:hypothetical protein [Deltaproteobacteria bacterium]
MRTWIAMSMVLALVGPACNSSSTPDDAVAETSEDPTAEVAADTTEEPAADVEDDSPGVVCELGTIYPGGPVIDPDAPIYSDSMWTQEEVEAAFAAAKVENNAFYRGYLAAYKYPEVLECPFCACGCATMSISHLSAVDCFKDMHGFA